MKWIDVPPVWLCGALVLAWLQSRLMHLDLNFPGPLPDLFAGLLIGGGVLLAMLAVFEMRRSRTTVLPHHTPIRLVTSGVFSRTRNPIYLADLMILAGFTLWWDAVLSLALLPVLLWVLERRFVAPEENRMRREFRKEFAAYENRVRRWL